MLIARNGVLIDLDKEGCLSHKFKNRIAFLIKVMVLMMLLI